MHSEYAASLSWKVNAIMAGIVIAFAGPGVAQDTPARPVAPFAPMETEAREQVVRQARDRLFAATAQGMPPLADEPPGVPPRVTKVHKVPLPELPVFESDMILVGRVTSFSPHLVPDGGIIYTEYRVDVRTILKNTTRWKGPVLDIVEIGGEGQLPSGRILRHHASGFGEPILAGTEYVMLLRYVEGPDCARIVKLWRLRDRKAEAVSGDDIARVATRESRVNGLDQDRLLEEIRARMTQR